MSNKNLKINSENLPSTIPIFPITGALLLPGVETPLNIFEPKYLNMVDDALAERKIIGLIQPQQKLISKISRTKKLYQVGCAGRIRTYNETDDGRYIIVLDGLIRFKIEDEIATTRGYRRFKVDWQDYMHDLKIDEEREKFEFDFEKREIVEKIDNFLQSNDIGGSISSAISIDNIQSAFIIDFLCCYLPFSPEEKQLFLESRDVTDRAKNLFDILGIAEYASKFGNISTLH